MRRRRGRQQTNISNLPGDIYSLITEYLPDESIGSLEQLNKSTNANLSKITQDDRYWAKKIAEKYGKTPEGLMFYGTPPKDIYLDLLTIGDNDVHRAEIWEVMKGGKTRLGNLLSYGKKEGFLGIVRLVLAVRDKYFISVDDLFEEAYNESNSELAATLVRRGYITELPSFARTSTIMRYMWPLAAQLVMKGIIDAEYEGNTPLKIALEENDLDMLKFLLKGDKINLGEKGTELLDDVIQNEDGEVVAILFTNDYIRETNDPEELFVKAFEDYTWSIWSNLLEYKIVDPSMRNGLPLMLSIEHSELSNMEYLLTYKEVDPSANDNEALREVLNERGDYTYNMVKCLISDERVDPSVENNGAFLLAVRNDDFPTAKRILADSRVDPSANNNQMLMDCINLYNSDVYPYNFVRLILSDPRVDPSIENNRALELARRKGLANVESLLLRNKRVASLDTMK